MTVQQLENSWKRTETFLLDARAHMSEAAEAECTDEIAEFQEFVEHNELELALNALEGAYSKSQWESHRVLELLALAAASMGLADRQREFDQALTKARGWAYITVLPPGGA